jgi:hypothetical protein
MIRKIINNIYVLLLVTGGLAAFTSCSNDTADEPTPDIDTADTDLHVSFTLAVQSAQAAGSARAGAWGDTYTQADAVTFENRINTDNLIVTFYNSDTGNHIGNVTDLRCTEFYSQNTLSYYEFQGVLQLGDSTLTVDQLRQTNVKMMVTANATTTANATVLTANISAGGDSGPGSLQFTAMGDTSMFTAIPMWGVSSPSMANITQGHAWNVGTIDLLRAMAKFEIDIDSTNSELDNVQFTDITVNRLNASGYILPGAWNEISTTKALTFAQTLRVPPTANVANDITFNAATTGRDITFYVPEIKNSSDYEIILSLHYSVGSEQRTGIIRLCPYADGKPTGNPLWDILRNHHYHYTITSVGTLIRFNVSVHEWDVVEKNLEM